MKYTLCSYFLVIPMQIYLFKMEEQNTREQYYCLVSSHAHFVFEGGRGRGDGRRITLSSLVVSSMNALDYTVNPVTPQYQYPRKKPKLNVSMLFFYFDHSKLLRQEYISKF